MCDGDFSRDDPRDIITDDESYFTLSGAGMPGNRGYYTSNPSKTPNQIKHRQEDKFPEKVMVWAVIGTKGIGEIFIAPKRTSMDSQLYQNECLTRVLDFIDTHYESRDDCIFWPDLATCHYSESSQNWMKNNNLTFVPKHSNPPNAPQIRPIEAFWAILKMKVYEGNWSAKNRDQLIRRIKKSIQEIDMEIIVKMFKNLKDKIHYAKEHGLESLI